MPAGDGGCTASTPDPETARHVQWIFTQRLAGSSAAGIARTLNTLGVIPPSAHDWARNSHRTGAAWTLRTVAATLGNPRYTGRQVWNRQSVDHHETGPGDKTTRSPARRPTHGWNTKDQWVISTQQAHPPLISEADFVHAQRINATTRPDDDGAPPTSRCITSSYDLGEEQTHREAYHQRWEEESALDELKTDLRGRGEVLR